MEVKIIGGGLAGSELALQLAKRGINVCLYEMRPVKMTPAHRTGYFAELVCSNSLKSENPLSAHGLLKEELKLLDSRLLECAFATRVEAGEALAVDREKFARMVSSLIENSPNIKVIREEVMEIPSPIAVIATGPLTSTALSDKIAELTGEENLYFYDAISPLIYAESIDMKRCVKGGRKGKDDYLNIPLTREEYYRFVNELLSAEKVLPHPFEEEKYFEGCLPIEVMAERGIETLAHGPMKPVGLKGMEWAHAVVQLRKENREGTLYNMVGFQTKLKIKEQIRIFRSLPGLEKAEFARYGSVHRNTFIKSPEVLTPFLEMKKKEGIFFAGQLTGVEGYVECIATGVILGINIYRILKGLNPVLPPETTMIGGLLRYIANPRTKNFQPMNANFGLIPSVKKGGFLEKRRIYFERALKDLKRWIETSLNF